MGGEPGLDELRVEAELLGDQADVEPLLRRHERDPLAGPAGASGATHAVDVGVVVGGRIEVDHVRDVLEVEPTGGDVGRDQDVVRTRREPAERTFALWLRHAAMELTGMEALFAQDTSETIRPVLGPDEHQREPPIGRELAHERLGLLRVLHTDEAVVGVGRS